jgi:hypothetical protein
MATAAGRPAGVALYFFFLSLAARPHHFHEKRGTVHSCLFLPDIDGSPGELLSWAGRPNTQDSIKRLFFSFLIPFLSVSLSQNPS